MILLVMHQKMLRTPIQSSKDPLLYKWKPLQPHTLPVHHCTARSYVYGS